jgi:mannose-6-phosphate isomerase
MKELLFFEPVFINLIWGREIWTVSAHEHGDCKVRSGQYKGQNLSQLWKSHRELFGNIQGEVFPLLVKKIEARDDLSIQVHPDDKYAKESENGSLGKTECWYVLDCENDGSIIIGHNAKTKSEVREMITENRWEELLREIPVKKGDFFQIEPGTIHAIKRNTSIMEIQQNSDITYRLYDYGRQMDGELRELHIDKSIDVIKVPFEDKKISVSNGKVLVSCQYYTVSKYDIEESKIFKQDKCFQIISIISGTGSINGYPIVEGESFVIPFAYGEYILKGKIEILLIEI